LLLSLSKFYRIYLHCAQTFTKIASMGWMFCPLEQYHGGGDAAIIEPIGDHLQEYEWVLATYFGTGVQSAYRGYRLYDPAVPASKALVAKWVRFFQGASRDSQLGHYTYQKGGSAIGRCHAACEPGA
jgi:hypothetical protein